MNQQNASGNVKTAIVAVEGFITVFLGVFTASVLGLASPPDPTTMAGQHELIVAAWVALLLAVKRVVAVNGSGS